MLTATLVALAGASVLLACHEYAQYRIARWQAAETARLVRLAVFGPDGPTDDDQRAVREALQVEQPDVAVPVVRGGQVVPQERLGPGPSLDDVLRHLAPQPSRSAAWADPPQGSARARRRPPSGG